MGRSPCCSKVGLRRGPWSTKEDTLLTSYIQEHGEGQWSSLPKKAGLLRCGKSCRLRWMNYLRPGVKRGNISEDEEDLIVRLQGLLGNRWSLIAGRLPGRTDNEIKNYWNTHLLKKLKNAGIHPKPHKDLPKPPEIKKSTAADGGSTTTTTGKKKNMQKKAVNVDDENNNNNNGNNKLTGSPEEATKTEEQINNPPKTKVHLPKPVRVSSAFSRTNSYDTLVSGTSRSDGREAAEKVVSYVPMTWHPLFELDEADDEDDFLGGGYILPLLLHPPSYSISSDVNMLEEKCCDICGDIGKEEAIITCSQCKSSSEHMYCMRIVLQKHIDDWLCKDCGSGSKPTSLASSLSVELPMSKLANSLEARNGAALHRVENC